MSLLNLQKNEVLDLTKKDPSLNNIILAGGWDVSKKGLFGFGSTMDLDLDLSALLLDENDKLLGSNGIIYYRNLRGQGILLHGDNRTGEGSGDDEKISITLNNLPSICKKVVFCVNIFQAQERNQDFSKVKNAYVRILNCDKGNAEVCRYNLSEDGKNATALTFAELYREGSDWNFKAIGELSKDTLSSLVNKYK